MVEGKQVPGERVVIVDNDGYFMGVSLAEKLASEGKKVTLMTHARPHRAVHALHPRGAEHAPQAAQARRRDRHLPRPDAGSSPARVAATHVYDEDGHEHTWEADAVVLVTQRRSNEALYRELKDVVGFDALRRGGRRPAATGSATARRRG